MTLDIILGMVFLGSTGLLAYKLFSKIPELVSVRDEVVMEKFRNDSVSVRFFLLHIRTYYKEGLFGKFFWNIATKLLYRLHLLFLKLDNSVVSVLKKIREEKISVPQTTDDGGDNAVGHEVKKEETADRAKSRKAVARAKSPLDSR